MLIIWWLWDRLMMFLRLREAQIWSLSCDSNFGGGMCFKYQGGIWNWMFIAASASIVFQMRRRMNRNLENRKLSSLLKKTRKQNCCFEVSKIDLRLIYNTILLHSSIKHSMDFLFENFSEIFDGFFLHQSYSCFKLDVLTIDIIAKY